MTATESSVPEVARAGYHYAGFWWRVLAFLIDIVVIWLAIFVLALVVAVVAPFMPAYGGMDPNTGSVLGVVCAWLYFALQESSSRRATLGKRACGLSVSDVSGQRISFG